MARDPDGPPAEAGEGIWECGRPALRTDSMYSVLRNYSHGYQERRPRGRMIQP